MPIHHRGHMCHWFIWSCFAVSFVLDGLLALIMKPGYQTKRLRSDAGMAFGITASLGSACTSLGMVLARRGAFGQTVVLVYWTLFASSCVLSGMLLVMLMRDMPL